MRVFVTGASVKDANANPVVPGNGRLVSCGAL